MSQTHEVETCNYCKNEYPLSELKKVLEMEPTVLTGYTCSNCWEIEMGRTEEEDK